MKIFILVSVILMGWSLNSWGGDSGFVYQGKEYVTYRDGKKVGKAATEVLRQESRAEDAHENRMPAGTATDLTSSEDLIFFQRNGGGTCYFLANHSGISCVKQP